MDLTGEHSAVIALQREAGSGTRGAPNNLELFAASGVIV
jgi:hypothetical protein